MLISTLTFTLTLVALAKAAALENVLLAEEYPADSDDYYPEDSYEDLIGPTTPPTTNVPTTPEASRRRQGSTLSPASYMPVCTAGAPVFRESRYTMLGSALMIFPSLEITCEGEISQWDFLPVQANTSQLYLAVWHHSNPTKAFEFGLRGMNNPNITAVPGRWAKWVVPADKRIHVYPGDKIGYFYVNWVVNATELVLPLAVPRDDYDKKSFKSLNAGVFAAMLGLPEVVQRHNGIIDFATLGAFLPAYAIPPIKVTVMPKITAPTTMDPFQALMMATLRDVRPAPTINPDITSPSRRCTHLPTPFDEAHRPTNCRPERFLRYFYSQTLKTCVFFYFSTCTDIPGRLPYQIKTGNNFDTVEQCLNVCSSFVDSTVEPVLPPTDYGFDDKYKK